MNKYLLLTVITTIGLISLSVFLYIFWGAESTTDVTQSTRGLCSPNINAGGNINLNKPICLVVPDSLPKEIKTDFISGYFVNEDKKRIKSNVEIKLMGDFKDSKLADDDDDKIDFKFNALTGTIGQAVYYRAETDYEGNKLRSEGVMNLWEKDKEILLK